jgi:predicted DNA binding CopG/RHH family protein
MGKDTYVTVRFKDRERMIIKKASTLLHLPESTYIRLIVLRDAERRILASEKAKDIQP